MSGKKKKKLKKTERTNKREINFGWIKRSLTGWKEGDRKKINKKWEKKGKKWNSENNANNFRGQKKRTRKRKNGWTSG